jgi:diguanylate cyclase (GGDEF)-like protein
MWIGYRYGGGIDRIHPKAGGATIDKSVQRRGTDGLVYFLHFDAKGRLWAGTERGVDVWNGSSWSHYDTSDGLAWDDCNLNAFAEEADGTVWIGTSGGLSRFKPLHSSSESPLDVIFTTLAIGGVDVSGRQNPSFNLHSNSLVVRYSALNAAHENSVVFRYLLEGASSTWVETTQRELHFAQLAPGAYRLDIGARGSDGIWSAHGASFSFKILTPWYKTWWFAALCGLIPLLLAAVVVRLRMLGARRREVELLHLVEAKTVELRKANAELLQLSSIDPLTGLANRRVFDRILSNECARLKRTGSGAVSLLILDVDHFKALNDSKGHQQGDHYLIMLGAELTRVARRQTDTAARCGGEEFALILPGTTALDAACIADSVRSAILALKLPHPASPSAPILTISIGVATATSDWLNTPEDLVAAADAALYAAKRNGRNRVEVAPHTAVSDTVPTTAVSELV